MQITNTGEEAKLMILDFLFFLIEDKQVLIKISENRILSLVSFFTDKIFFFYRTELFYLISEQSRTHLKFFHSEKTNLFTCITSFKINLNVCYYEFRL